MRTPAPIPRAALGLPDPTPRPWILPSVLGLSVGAHGIVLVLAALLPAPPLALHDAPSELAFTVIAPEPEEVAPAPEPDPVPVVEERPAAIVERPQPRRVERDVEPSDEPPPPAPVMTAPGEGTADWQHAAGEENGVLGGTPGGEGTGGPASEGALAEAPPAPRGISRAELRRRLLGYMRGTLWSFVNGRIDYPLAARRSHLEGVVMLRIRLARDGSLLGVRLSQSSGHSMLDQAALASVQRLASMPAPPDSIPWDDGQELPLPVTYQLVR